MLFKSLQDLNKPSLLKSQILKACKGKALDCFPFVSRRETIRNHGNPKGYNNAFFTKKSMHACASHKIKGYALDCFPLGNHGHPLGDNLVLLLFLPRKNNNKHACASHKINIFALACKGEYIDLIVSYAQLKKRILLAPCAFFGKPYCSLKSVILTSKEGRFLR